MNFENTYEPHCISLNKGMMVPAMILTCASPKAIFKLESWNSVQLPKPQIYLFLADAAWKHLKYLCFYILPLQLGVNNEIYKHDNDEVICSNRRRNKSPKEMSGNSRLHTENMLIDFIWLNYRLNISYKQFYITLNVIWVYESDPNAASKYSEPGDKTAYGVDVIKCFKGLFTIRSGNVTFLSQVLWFKLSYRFARAHRQTVELPVKFQSERNSNTNLGTSETLRDPIYMAMKRHTWNWNVP